MYWSEGWVCIVEIELERKIILVDLLEICKRYNGNLFIYNKWGVCLDSGYIMRNEI